MKNAAEIFLNRSDLDDAELAKLFQDQRDFFKMGKTRELDFRFKQLKKLKRVIKEHEAEILYALSQDFGKPPFEAYASEVGFMYEEINLFLKKLKGWAKPKRVSTPLINWPAKSYILSEPKGVCLIIGPWNYPFQLIMAPLVAAIAAGNTAFVKPPEQTPHLSNLLTEMLSAHFDQELITVVQGEGHEIVPRLMNNFRFDHVFFTGSVPVGRAIGEMAAKKLVPATLELGGKSPCIIDDSADFKVAARRIAFGKWLNAGQTCVAPDYLLVHRPAWNEFKDTLIETLKEFYPQGALASEDYTSLINEKRYESIAAYLEEGELIYGGEQDPDSLRIGPSLLLNPPLDGKVMQEEIFGPVLPILVYDFREDAVEIIEQNPDPLAFYLFSTKSMEQEFWQKRIRYGGGAINSAIVHLANPALPFGGIGNSGIGNYHGKYGFQTFSHQKSMMKAGTWLDPKMKYPPFSQGAYKLIRRLMS